MKNFDYENDARNFKFNIPEFSNLSFERSNKLINDENISKKRPE